jgi:acylphosphatase
LNEKQMVAKQVFYSGRVQGVGFRYGVKHTSGGFEVTGWVRNLPDGRVEMQAMAEDAEELTAFLQAIRDGSHVRDGSHGGNIKAVEEHVIAPLAGVKGFSIVH